MIDVHPVLIHVARVRPASLIDPRLLLSEFIIPDLQPGLRLYRRQCRHRKIACLEWHTENPSAVAAGF